MKGIITATPEALLNDHGFYPQFGIKSGDIVNAKDNWQSTHLFASIQTPKGGWLTIDNKQNCILVVSDQLAREFSKQEIDDLISYTNDTRYKEMVNTFMNQNQPICQQK